MCAQSCAKHMLFRCDPLLPSRHLMEALLKVVSLSRPSLSQGFPLCLSQGLFSLSRFCLSLSLSLSLKLIQAFLSLKALSLKVFSLSLSLSLSFSLSLSLKALSLSRFSFSQSFSSPLSLSTPSLSRFSLSLSLKKKRRLCEKSGFVCHLRLSHIFWNLPQNLRRPKTHWGPSPIVGQIHLPSTSTMMAPRWCPRGMLGAH